MALLRLSDGRIYTDIDDISSLIGSTRIGAFDYPRAVREKVASLATPLTGEGADYVLENLDVQAADLPASEGLTHRRIGCVIPPKQMDGDFVFAFGATAEDAVPEQQSAEELRAYLTPHAVQATDWHFVMSGAIVKGLELEDGLQGVLYVQAGEWIRLNKTVKNWPVFPYGQSTIGVSFFDTDPSTIGQIEYPEIKPKPEMAY